MKAIVYEKFGTPDVLEYREIEKPVPGEHDVLVRVIAASVNSWDWDLLRGVPCVLRLGPPKYRILGADISGRVEAVGNGVEKFLPGDKVFGDISGCGWGGFAEYVCAREDVLTRMSDSMTFEVAAAVPQAGVLALQALRDAGRIQPGQTVLINGAGGGVGTFAVQLARHFQTEVTGVDGAEKLAMLLSLGVDRVVDYTKEDFTRAAERYDLIVDVVARRRFRDYSRVLNPGGTVVLVGGSIIRALMSLPLCLPVVLFRRVRMKVLLHRPNRRDLDSMRTLVEAGSVAPVIDSRFQLREVPLALRYFGEGRMKGKIVITVDGTEGGERDLQGE